MKSTLAFAIPFLAIVGALHAQPYPKLAGTWKVVDATDLFVGVSERPKQSRWKEYLKDMDVKIGPGYLSIVDKRQAAKVELADSILLGTTVRFTRTAEPTPLAQFPGGEMSDTSVATGRIVGERFMKAIGEKASTLDAIVGVTASEDPDPIRVCLIGPGRVAVFYMVENVVMILEKKGKK